MVERERCWSWVCVGGRGWCKRRTWWGMKTVGMNNLDFLSAHTITSRHTPTTNVHILRSSTSLAHTSSYTTHTHTNEQTHPMPFNPLPPLPGSYRHTPAFTACLYHVVAPPSTSLPPVLLHHHHTSARHLLAVPHPVVTPTPPLLVTFPALSSTNTPCFQDSFSIPPSLPPYHPYPLASSFPCMYSLPLTIPRRPPRP